MRPVAGGRDGDDAVVIGGITLGFHQRLSAAVRAGVEIGSLRRLAVEGSDDRFGVTGRLMNSAMTEVDDLFRMIEGPSGGLAAILMASVRGGGGVSVAYGIGEAGVADRAGVASVTNALKLAVPVGG